MRLMEKYLNVYTAYLRKFKNKFEKYLLRKSLKIEKEITYRNNKSLRNIKKMVPRVGVEPTHLQEARHFERLASANSATEAKKIYFL